MGEKVVHGLYLDSKIEGIDKWGEVAFRLHVIVIFSRIVLVQYSVYWSFPIDALPNSRKFLVTMSQNDLCSELRGEFKCK